jgi:Na+-transporting methylmalonyl-CoA/oxaloacetate decarboxylase gamma subunit
MKKFGVVFGILILLTVGLWGGSKLINKARPIKDMVKSELKPGQTNTQGYFRDGASAEMHLAN